MLRAPRAPPTHGAVCPSGTCRVGVAPSPTVVLSALLPRGGPVAGGTEVRLDGIGLGRSRGRLMQCDFGGLVVQAELAPGPESEIVPGVQLRCRSPVMPVAEAVAVRVSIDGGSTWVAGTPRFAYYDAPVVRALRPASGPTAGGTLVLVLGAGFGPHPALGPAVTLCRHSIARALPAWFLQAILRGNQHHLEQLMKMS